MIVLDTHAWIWFVSDPRKLSRKANQAVVKAAAERLALISSISVWEAALLVLKGRLQLRMEFRDWLAKCEALPHFQFVPVDNAIAVKSVFLPAPMHPDRADRIIAATALTVGVPLVTKDERLLSYRALKTIW